jgi:hypothetical protein
VVRPLEGLTSLMSANEAAASDACLDRVPARATVAASSILVPHLTHRPDVTLLSRADGQAYLAVAGRPADPAGYRRVCHHGDVTVLRRS